MFGTNQREPFFFPYACRFCKFGFMSVLDYLYNYFPKNTCHFKHCKLSVFLWDSGIECNSMWKWYCCDHVEVKSTAVECFSDQVKPLIWIESVIEKHSHSRIEYMIKVRSSKIIMATFSLLSHLFSVLGQQCMYFCTNI